MPKLIIDGKVNKVLTGRRLVLAIEEAGIRIGHLCGGFARRTTCRVAFLAGKPDSMTAAEYALLKGDNLLGKARLACQITCEQEMSVHPLVTANDRPEWDDDCGPLPLEAVTRKRSGIQSPALVCNRTSLGDRSLAIIRPV